MILKMAVGDTKDSTIILNNVALTTLSINKSDFRRKSQIRVTIG